MVPPPNRRRRKPSGSPVGAGIVWSARIIAIGLAMFLPGVAGGWLDERFGLRLFGPAGFLVGLGTAIFWLAQISDRPQE